MDATKNAHQLDILISLICPKHLNKFNSLLHYNCCLAEHVVYSICKAETNFFIRMAPQEIRNSTQCILLFKFPYNFSWHLIVISMRLYAGIWSVLAYSPYPAVSDNNHLRPSMILCLQRTESQFTWMKHTTSNSFFFLYKMTEECLYLFHLTLDRV